MPNKGRLRNALENTMSDNPATRKVMPWWARVYDRYQKYFADLGDPFEYAKTHTVLETFANWWLGGVYALTGLEWAIKVRDARDASEVIDDTGNQIVELIDTVSKSSTVQSLTKLMGSLVTEPVLSILEEGAESGFEDPKEFARKFHGVMLSLSTAGSIISPGVEAITGGTIKNAGKIVEGIYWNLGLGFLGWQTLAPLLEAGLQPGLERYYKEKFRPMRFSASELRDLFALGKIGDTEIQNAAAELGWRDQDIKQWIELAYRTLGEGDIWTLYNKGDMGEEEVKTRLRAIGYDPNDFTWLFKANGNPDANDAKDTTAATAKKAFKEGIIGETRFSEILRKLKMSEEEIDLQVQLINLANETDARTLTVAQIKNAWEENVLTETEANFHLLQAGVDQDAAAVLIQTWKAENEPVFRKLNSGTITNAYVEGVIDRGQAAAKLQAIGFSAEDAVLILDVTEKKNPAVFSGQTETKIKTLSVSQLKLILSSGLITAAAMETRLVAQGYTEEDAKLLVQASIPAETETRAALTKSIIEQAYLTGVINRQGAYDRLVEIDFSPEDASLILDTLEAKNPLVFHPELIRSSRVPGITALIQAFNNGIISEDDYYFKTSDIGYSHEDAALYLANASIAATKTQKTLTQSQIVNAYGKGLMTRSTAEQRLVSMGYGVEDANILLRLEKDDIADSEVWYALMNGEIDAGSAIGQLFSANYTITDIDIAFHQITAQDVSRLGIDIVQVFALLNELKAQYAVG